jgi:hypothetical protein
MLVLGGGDLGQYRNTMHCLTEVLKAEGPSALFIGMAPTLLRYYYWHVCVEGGGGAHHQLRCVPHATAGG